MRYSYIYIFVNQRVMLRLSWRVELSDGAQSVIKNSDFVRFIDKKFTR